MGYFCKNKKSKQNSGFMIVEVIVASAITVAGALAAMSFVHSTNLLARQTLHNAQASFLSEESAEIARIIRDNSWTNFSSFSVAVPYYPVFDGTTWTLSTTPNTVGIFTRKIIFDRVYRDDSTHDIEYTAQSPCTSCYEDTNIRAVNINISWAEAEQTKGNVLSIYLANI